MSFNAARRVMRTRRLTAQQLCDMILVSKRTVRRWLISDLTRERQDIPGPAAILLHLWLGGAVTRPEIERARDEVIHRQAPRPPRRVKQAVKSRGNRPR